MAEPVDFKGTNRTLHAPQGRDDVSALRAFSNAGTCVTCWRLSLEEVQEIVATGRVWLSILFGGTMPPALVGSESTMREFCADYGGTFPRQDEPPAPAGAPAPGTVAGQWESYHQALFCGALSGVALQETRRAFYAGAQAFFGLVTAESDPGDESTERRLEALHRELRAFTEEVRAGRR